LIGNYRARQLATSHLTPTWHDHLPVAVPAFSRDQVYAALDPGEAVEAVREAFLEHARGSWTMPSKVYVEATDGDFRAMPAAGAGHTVLKWVTSFPGNPARGLPTVSGVVLLSDAATGELRALLDAGAVTALRTGAAAVLAAETLSVEAASPAAVIGCGVNGRAVARTFLARGRDVLLWDARPEQAAAVAAELGERASVAREAAEALSSGVVVTVTPGHEPVFRDGDLRPGQHVSLMGADGPGKAEITDGELARARVVCDEWEQASHNGDLGHAFAAGVIRREDVAELGHVLLGTEERRRGDEEITIFDSTGLAVQDLAVALAVYRRYQQDPESDVFGDTVNVPIG
jgi:alanine dehydrogenase